MPIRGDKTIVWHLSCWSSLGTAEILWTYLLEDTLAIVSLTTIALVTCLSKSCHSWLLSVTAAARSMQEDCCVDGSKSIWDWWWLLGWRAFWAPQKHSYPPPDLCLDTILFHRSTHYSLDLLACSFTCLTYTITCATETWRLLFSIMPKEFSHLTRVNWRMQWLESSTFKNRIVCEYMK